MAVRPRIFSRLRDWAGRQLVVEDHRVGVDRQRQVPQLLGLAPPDVGGRIGLVASLQDPGRLVGAGRVDQEGQLVQVALRLLLPLGRNGHPDQDDLLPEAALDQAHTRHPAGGDVDARDRRASPIRRLATRRPPSRRAGGR